MDLPAQGPEPPTSDDSRQWEKYEDMLDSEDPDAIQMFGFRIAIFVDSAGQEWVRWGIDGDPSLNECVAALERTKFLMMMHALEGDSDGS